MFRFLRISASFLLLSELLFVFINDAEGTEERNIFFNRDHYEAEHQEAKEKLLNISEKICPNHKQEIKAKIEEFQKCSKTIDEDEMTMCQVIENNLKICLLPINKLFESCVPEKAKGLPTYALRTANATVRYLCDIDGAHLLELSNPCFLRKNHPFSRTCIKKLKNELSQYDFDKLPEKKVLCLFLKDFRHCFKTHLENSCQDSITREAYLGVYDAMLCEDDKS